MSETPTAPEENALPPAPAEDDAPFRIADYLVVNVAFLAFLGVTYGLMRALFPETGGLSFFFILLGCGFIGVSIYDFIFDRLYTPPTDED